MPEVDILKISNDDAAFVLGRNGRTKEKIARVSGADLDLFEQSLTLEIRGTDSERKRAKRCARPPTPPPPFLPPSPPAASSARPTPTPPKSLPPLTHAHPPPCLSPPRLPATSSA